jgi:hypothetical protein
MQKNQQKTHIGYIDALEILFNWSEIWTTSA